MKTRMVKVSDRERMMMIYPAEGEVGGVRYESVVLGGLYIGPVHHRTGVDQWTSVDQCGPVWTTPLESTEMLHVHCLPRHPHQELI